MGKAKLRLFNHHGNCSSSKETKTHFLIALFTRVRDRTACLNSFCVVALMQHKRVSSDSPTPIGKTNVSQERYVCFADWGNALKIKT